LVIVLPKEVSNTTPLKSVRKIQKETAIDHPASRRSVLHLRRGKGINLLIQKTVVFSADLRKPTKCIDTGGGEPIQNWNDLSSHSIPQVIRLDIAGIFSKRQPCHAKVGQNFLSLRVVQGPNHLVIAKRRHAGKAGKSRTTKHPEQDRLGLIVCRMAYGDTTRAAFFGNLPHHRIAAATSHSLQ
jgi:hypothetical protein